MINRQNWKLAKAYIEYRQAVDRLGDGSAEVERTHLRHILEWADDVSFLKAKTIRPTLPDYVLSLHVESETGRFSGVHVTKILATARRLFEWAALNRSEYHALKVAWIETLKAKRLEELPKKLDAVSLDEIFRIASAPVADIVERRIRASATFWYLSGIRVGAFVTLPIGAVDLKTRTVKQHPSLGVRTKNRKYATTTLLDIPELLAVVREWDDEIRAVLPLTGFWFAPLSSDTQEIDPTAKEVGNHRDAIARENLRDWLEKVGLPYHSPHKFRHGHIHYGLERAKTMADFKAVSLNVMHASIKITDQVYSRLSDDEIRTRVEKLSDNRNVEDEDLEADFKLFQEFMEWRKMRK